MEVDKTLDVFRRLGEEAAGIVLSQLKNVPLEQRIAVDHHGSDDVIYAIDRAVEDLIETRLEEQAAALGGIILIAEGLAETGRVFPSGMVESDAALRVLMDPIDGTRGIMYDKRSAFFLAGIAPNRGADTRLRDIHVAVAVELPVSRAALRDTLWAVKDQGANRETVNLFTDSRKRVPLQATDAKTIRGGFAQISRFFPPGKDILSAIEEEMLRTLFPDAPASEILTFEDQYISSGGQLYELVTGKDRFTADLRTGLDSALKKEGRTCSHICHPYDLAAHLIGKEAGVIVTGPDGDLLDAPFSTTAPVDWIGYGNRAIRQEVEPVLIPLLKKYGLSV